MTCTEISSGGRGIPEYKQHLPPGLQTPGTSWTNGVETGLRVFPEYQRDGKYYPYLYIIYTLI